MNQTCLVYVQSWRFGPAEFTAVFVGFQADGWYWFAIGCETSVYRLFVCVF